MILAGSREVGMRNDESARREMIAIRMEDSSVLGREAEGG